MSVKVKYHLFDQNQHPIKSIALQNQYLAISSGIDEEWLSLQKVKIQPTSNEPITFEKAETPTLSRRPISFLSWSPDGKLLASAFDKLTLWELQNESQNLKKIQEYQDHSLEITAIAWSPDSTRIATCSLDAKVVITDLQTRQKIKEIDSGNKAVGIAWDPFDKYVACLRFDNKVVIWKISSWEKYTEINLNFPNSQTEKYTSKREDRKIDWSPDCRYLLVPSMDDRVVPVVCALDRHQEFKVSKTFMGPFSSVNTVKFSPVLVVQEGIIKSVFAMGDNDGNISVWHLSQKGPEKPIFLLKNTSGELIEDIVWSKDGSVMMATTMKRYLIIVVFDTENTLGKSLNEEECKKYLQEVYGGTRQQITSVVGQPSIKIRTYNNSRLEVVEQKGQPIQEEHPIQQTQEQITYTQQQVVVSNGRKKIIPKMQVTQISEQPQPIQEIQKPSAATQVPQTNLIMIKQPPVLPLQCIHYLSTKEGSCLLFESIRIPRLNTLIKCLRTKDKYVRWADQVEGQIIHIQSNQEHICLYTDKNFLYVNDINGKRQCPPVVLPGICRMHLSNQSDLLIIQEQCDFKVLSLKEQRVILEGDIKNLVIHAYEQLKKTGKLNEEELKGNQFFDPLIQAYLMKDIDGGAVPHLLLRTQAIYSYQRNINEWVRSKQLEINSQDTSKLQILELFQFNTKEKKNQNDTFFSKLVMDNDTNYQRVEALSDIQQVACFEEQLTQLCHFQDGSAFCNVVYSYIKKICDTLPLNSDKLHDIIMRVVVSESSEEALYLTKAKISRDDVKKNISYILSQYPRAKEYKYLIE